MDLPPQVADLQREVNSKLEAGGFNVDFKITYCKDGVIQYSLTSRDATAEVPKAAQKIVDACFKDYRSTRQWSSDRSFPVRF